MVQAAEHPVERRLVELVGGDVRRQGVADLGAVAVVVEAGAGHRDDPGVVGQLALAVAEVEGRQQLAEGQVAGAAEDDEVGGTYPAGQLGHGSSLERGCWASHNRKATYACAQALVMSFKIQNG